MTGIRTLFRIALALAMLLPLAACIRISVKGDPAAAMDTLEQLPEAMTRALAPLVPLRVATYNVSLYDDHSDGLLQRLRAGDADARRIAAVLQRVRPDIVLLNEFDYDANGRAINLFQRDYLEMPQAGGGAPLTYPYRYLGPVNTGEPSGLDLDGDGRIGGEGRAAGNDAWGYGLHPGQYGMVVLSRYPIDLDAVRSFRLLRWATLPDARQPRRPRTQRSWYPPATWQQLRLSSKSHWDVPVRTPQGVVHVLASHPTPPVFDGPEDRNGARNADEIRLWAEYLSPGDRPWLCDDAGHCGGLASEAHFVLLGDLNADPADGDGVPGAIAQVLQHPRVNADWVPRSPGAAERARRHGLPRKGDIHAHTGDFGPQGGTLRLDYVLPSRSLQVLDGGVFWPPEGTPTADLAAASDHRLVWLDVVRQPQPSERTRPARAQRP